MMEQRGTERIPRRDDQQPGRCRRFPYPADCHYRPVWPTVTSLRAEWPQRPYHRGLVALDVDDVNALAKTGAQIRQWVMEPSSRPVSTARSARAFAALANGNDNLAVAVRFLHTAEDLRTLRSPASRKPSSISQRGQWRSAQQSLRLPFQRPSAAPPTACTRARSQAGRLVRRRAAHGPFEAGTGDVHPRTPNPASATWSSSRRCLAGRNRGSRRGEPTSEFVHKPTWKPGVRPSCAATWATRRSR